MMTGETYSATAAQQAATRIETSRAHALVDEVEAAGGHIKYIQVGFLNEDGNWEQKGLDAVRPPMDDGDDGPDYNASCTVSDSNEPADEEPDGTPYKPEPRDHMMLAMTAWKVFMDMAKGKKQAACAAARPGDGKDEQKGPFEEALVWHRAMYNGEVREEFYTMMRADKELEKEFLKSFFDNWKVSLTVAWPTPVDARDLRWTTPLDHPGRNTRLLAESKLHMSALAAAPYRV
jgi:hypothetical protein